MYLKWNERLFVEMSDAYRNGRLGKDPADFWYDGELGFLDHYIIPLAMKLNDCGVFGVSSDEFLDYARANRHEWNMKGKGIVKDYVLRYNVSRKAKVSQSIIQNPNSSRNQTSAILDVVSAILAEE